MKKLLALLFSFALVFNSYTITLASEITEIDDVVSIDGTEYDYAVSSTDIYDTDNESEYDFGFENTIQVDGNVYNLNHVEYDVTYMYDEEIGKDIKYEIVVKKDVSFDDKETYIPEPTYMDNGFTYAFESVSFDEKMQISSFTSHIDTELLTDELDVSKYPATMPYDYNGKTYDVPYKNYEVMTTGWHDGYYLYGTIYNYDAATYQIGDVVIERNDADFDLDPRNYAAFLEGLDCDPDIYMVEDVFYKGEIYTNSEGIVCRDYVVECQIYGNTYKLNYEYNRYDYVANITYKLSAEDIEYIEGLKDSYSVTAYAYYDLEPVAEEEIEEKSSEMSVAVKIAIGAGVIIGIGLIVTLIIYLLRGGRKKTEDMNTREMKHDFKHL